MAPVAAGAGAAAAAGTIGYTIGEYLMNELGDAIEHGAQVQIKAAIDELDRQLTGRLREGVTGLQEQVDGLLDGERSVRVEGGALGLGVAKRLSGTPSACR